MDRCNDQPPNQEYWNEGAYRHKLEGLGELLSEDLEIYGIGNRWVGEDSKEQDEIDEDENGLLIRRSVCTSCFFRAVNALRVALPNHCRFVAAPNCVLDIQRAARTFSVALWGRNVRWRIEDSLSYHDCSIAQYTVT